MLIFTQVLQSFWIVIKNQKEMPNSRTAGRVTIFLSRILHFLVLLNIEPIVRNNHTCFASSSVKYTSLKTMHEKKKKSMKMFFFFSFYDSRCLFQLLFLSLCVHDIDSGIWSSSLSLLCECSCFCSITPIFFCEMSLAPLSFPRFCSVTGIILICYPTLDNF